MVYKAKDLKLHRAVALKQPSSSEMCPLGIYRISSSRLVVGADRADRSRHSLAAEDLALRHQIEVLQTIVFSYV